MGQSPGEYVPDVTEGITRVEDLPQPRVEQRSRNYKTHRCPRSAVHAPRCGTACRDDALRKFTGSLDIDELYDGPFCVLSLVDNRTFRRLAYRVLEKDPTHADTRAFLRDVRAQLDARGLAVQGITTDASALYPVPLAEAFPGVSHQVCPFHILTEIAQAVL